MNPEDTRTIERLGQEVYDAVFSLLDAEPDIDGEDAGMVADACQRIAQRRLAEEVFTETDTTHSLPVTILLDGYRAELTITGFHRERFPESGHMCTVAQGQWVFAWAHEPHPLHDRLTMLRAADCLGTLGYHNLPRNPDKCYGKGPRGDKGKVMA